MSRQPVCAPAVRLLPLACALLVGVAFSAPKPAAARGAEVGQLDLLVGAGPGIRLGHSLGASPANFALVLGSEFVATPWLSPVVDVVVGLGNSLPVWGRAGAKFRLVNIRQLAAPYVVVQLAGGGLFQVMGANLRWLGGRTGVGLDYAVADKATVGAGLFANLGSTLGQRPRFHGMFEVLIYVSFALAKAPMAQHVPLGGPPPLPLPKQLSDERALQGRLQTLETEVRAAGKKLAP